MAGFKPVVAAGASVLMALAGCSPKPTVTSASAPSARPPSPADIAYCDQLASLYERYGSAQDQRGEDFDVSVAEAIKQIGK